MLSEIATDAGHVTGPIVVTPAPRLAVVAGYLPATATDPARMMVNPVLLAALEPVVAPEPAPEVDAVNAVVRAPSNGPAAPTTPPRALATSAEGNPYSFYGSVAESNPIRFLLCSQNSQKETDSLKSESQIQEVGSKKRI